jgi:hypothetical protein
LPVAAPDSPSVIWSSRVLQSVLELGLLVYGLDAAGPSVRVLGSVLEDGMLMVTVPWMESPGFW